MKTKTKILTGLTIAALAFIAVLAASCDFSLPGKDGIYTFPESERPRARQGTRDKDQYITRIVVRDEFFAFHITGEDGINESDDSPRWSWWDPVYYDYYDLSDIVLTDLYTDEIYTAVYVERENASFTAGGAAIVTFKDVQHDKKSRFSLSNMFNVDIPVVFVKIDLSDAIFAEEQF